MTYFFFLPREIVPEAMDPLFDLLEGEKGHVARIVLGHWLFGYIHPYPNEHGHMALSHEPDARGRRLPLDRHPCRGPQRWKAPRCKQYSVFAAFIAERVKWSTKQVGTGKEI